MYYLGVVLGFNFHAGDHFPPSALTSAPGGYGGSLDGSGVCNTTRAILECRIHRKDRRHSR